MGLMAKRAGLNSFYRVHNKHKPASIYYHEARLLQENESHYSDPFLSRWKLVLAKR
jgi:hypothetical protein